MYWIRYAGLDGRIIFETSHSTKFRDAQSLLIQRKKDIEEGKQLDTYGELASAKKIEAQKRWLEYLKKVR